jgi:two-component system sensor histidine kinase PilS (NtrC family)
MDPARFVPTVGGRELRLRFRLVVAVRSALLAALAAGTLFFNLRGGYPFLGPTQLGLLGVLALTLASGLLYLAWKPRREPRWSLHIQLEVLSEALLAVGLVYLTGGAESPFSFLFALPIIAAALFFPLRGALVTAGLACVLLGTLLLLVHWGVLPPDLEGRRQASLPTGRVIYLLLLHDAIFLAIAWLASQLGEQLRRTGRALDVTTQDLEALASLNRDIVLSLRSGLVALDPEGRVSLLNPTAGEILGVEAREALGQPGVQLFPPLGQLMERPPAAGSPAGRPALLHRVQVSHQRRPGEPARAIGLTLSPLSRADGRPAGTLVHMQDLTEFRAMEAKVKRAERLAVLGEMAAVIAHEIRNPLASISGSAQMLSRSGRLEPTDQRLMEIIERETTRLDGLLGDFLAFARPKEPVRARVDLAALAQETLAMFGRSELSAGVRLEPRLRPAVGRVDAGQIRQVLWNLLTNAAQALQANGREGGRVRVSVGPGQAATGAWVELEVWDDGPGLPVELQDKALEPFFTTKEKGSGLGLAVVQRICEAHEGRVQFDCPPEGGCRVRVGLPGEEA